jgi:HK97 family phage prohead protease
MRPPPIIIPALPNAARRQDRDGRGPRPAAKPAPAVARRRFLGSDNRELMRPAIQGWGCFYDRAFHASGRYRIMRPGAFAQTVDDGASKALLFDHDSRRRIGGTDTGLEFASCAKGLAFRMPLLDDANGWAIYDAVVSNLRPCASVGATLIENKVRFTADLEYDFCTKASLQEISLVPEGAVSDTFSAVVDLDAENPYLFLACRSAGFAMQAATANATARAQRLVERLRDG